MPVAAFLPPTEDDLALAQEINDALPPHSRVQPYRVDCGDGSIKYGMIFEYWSARNPVERQWGFYPAAATVKEVEEWIASLNQQQAESWEIAH